MPIFLIDFRAILIKYGLFEPLLGACIGLFLALIIIKATDRPIIITRRKHNE